MKSSRNAENYSDPTSGQAIDNIMQERHQEVKKMIIQPRQLAGLSGFSIAERVVLVGQNAGRIYR